MNLRAKQLCILTVFIPVLFFATGVSELLAGFGITPPYVRNTSLTRNSIYEQEILLVRGESAIAEKAEISIDAPEIESWIQIIEGDEIIMDRGVQKVPMTVRVQVPSDAEFKDYTGAIRIRMMPADGSLPPGAVSISLGARVDIGLSVIDRVIEDFRVRRISVSDLNEGGKKAWLFFPGKIRFDVMIENTGNVDIAPSKVEFRIFDRAGKVLLEETKSTNKMTKVAPYATETVTAELPTRLPAGSYIARYKVFNGDDVKQEGDITLNIKPAGSLQTAGYGFLGLSIAHKISVLLPIFAVIIALLYLWRARRNRSRSRE